MPTRDEKYMALALFYSGFSKDKHTKMGAVIIRDNEILGMGYNGPPANISDINVNWEREPDDSGLCKHDVIFHSEANAIDYRKCDISDSVLYVTGMPCQHCALKIVRHKISRVVYYPYVSSDPNSMFSPGSKMFEKSQRIFELARKHISLERFDGDLSFAKEWSCKVFK